MNASSEAPDAALAFNAGRFDVVLNELSKRMGSNIGYRLGGLVEMGSVGSGFGAGAAQNGGFSSGGFAGGVSGRMGEHGGLRTGWLAAFSTEGYDGEPPLLEELGVNFGHIQSKVRLDKEEGYPGTSKLTDTSSTRH